MTVIDVPAKKTKKTKKNIKLNLKKFKKFGGRAALTPRSSAGSSAQGTPNLAVSALL
jgi:hypothetical protein